MARIRRLTASSPPTASNRSRALLDQELARGAGLDFLHSLKEIVGRHHQKAELFTVGLAGPARAGRTEAAEGDHADFLAEGLQVGADESVRMLGDLLEPDIGCERHGARMDPEDLKPAGRVGHADLDLPIEAARAAQRRVEHLGDIRGADHDHLAACDEPVHQAEQLGDDAFLHFADDFGALGRDGVDLVDEDDGGRTAGRLFEDFAEPRFALAVELAHDLRTVQVDEMDAALGRHGAGQKRLAGSRRPVQEHALRRQDAEPLEDAGVLQRELDDLAHARQLSLEPADVFIRDAGRLCRGLIPLDHPQIRPPIDDDRSRWNRARHLEVHRLGEGRHPDDRARDDGNALKIVEDPIEADRLRRRSADARQPDRHGGAVLDTRDRHDLLKAGAAVSANSSVNLDRPRFRRCLELGARHRHQPSGDLEHIAGPASDADEVGRGQASHGAADVFDASFGHAQRDARGTRRGAFIRRAARARDETDPIPFVLGGALRSAATGREDGHCGGKPESDAGAMWYTDLVVRPVAASLAPRSEAVKGARRAVETPAGLPGIEPIQRTRIPDEIANRIRRLIVDGTFEPGRPLPSERTLARRMKVSRSSVRDAIRRLEVVGLLERRHGQGTFLCELSVDNLVTPMASVLTFNRARQSDLMDVRRVFEPAVAAMAATRATRDELEGIDHILGAQRRKVRSGEPTIGEDTAFHAALARATHNSVIVGIMETLNDLLVESRERALQWRGHPLQSLRGHTAVVEALRGRDVNQASAAMRDHIDQIAALLERLPDRAARARG